MTDPTVKTPLKSALWIVLIFSSLAYANEAPQAGDRKNVLIFFIDDLRPELGCYGVDAIQSPSIDRLAQEGVLFERAYCQQALCAPSRISMMTGQYPNHTGIHGLFTPLRTVNKTALSLPQHFDQRGYVTASFGKVYHHLRDDQDVWTEIPTPPSAKYADPKTLDEIASLTKEAKRRKLDKRQKASFTKGPPTECYETADEGYRDGIVATQAIQSLRKNKDKPFLMCVGFAKPHLPFAAPKRYWDLYQRDSFKVPQRGRPNGGPDIAFTRWGELRGYREMPEEGELDDETTRKLMHGYAASVSFADAQVGKVMAELERLNLRENTIVVLWGDHGYKLGDYGMWCKHTNLELDARVPLIISAPGFKQGARSQALVEIVDLFPTVVSLSGGDIPKSLDGLKLDAVLKNPEKTHRQFAFTQYLRGKNMGYSLRNARWRYNEWVRTDSKKLIARELYDHRDTVTPDRNLAADPQYADLISTLSEQLKNAAID